MIKFAGIRSDEMNLVVEHYPTKLYPERNYEVIEVPGKDGDVIIDKGNFKNYRQTYSVFVDSSDPEFETYPQVTQLLAQWLLGNPGYQRLEDSYDPDFYRMAYYSGGTNFSNFFNVYGRGSLEFTCAPRRFYKIGEKEINVSNQYQLRSPSIFLAEPIYKITPSSEEPSLVVNDKTMSFTPTLLSPYVPFYVDVEKHITSYEDGTRVAVTNGEYEDLRLGKENLIAYNNISELILIPRWWTI